MDSFDQRKGDIITKSVNNTERKKRKYISYMHVRFTIYVMALVRH